MSWPLPHPIQSYFSGGERRVEKFRFKRPQKYRPPFLKIRNYIKIPKWEQTQITMESTFPNCKSISPFPSFLSYDTYHVMLLECKLIKNSSLICPKCLEWCLAYCTHSLNIYCWMIRTCLRHQIFKQKKPWKQTCSTFHSSSAAPTLHCSACSLSCPNTTFLQAP